MVIVTELVRCPFCGFEAPRYLFGFYARPEGREPEFASLHKCPNEDCKRWFAPLSAATLLAIDSKPA